MTGNYDRKLCQEIMTEIMTGNYNYKMHFNRNTTLSTNL